MGVVVDTWTAAEAASAASAASAADAIPNSAAQANYDDWAFVITPGRPFDVVINPRPHRDGGIAQFVCYGNVSGYLSEANRADSGVLDEWIEQFLAVAPGLRGHILGAEIRSWEHCFSLLTPERHTALAEIQRPVDGTLHFAGDYSSESAGTHGAYAEARRVAEEIASLLLR
ncbi:MAG: FAD-dependent oxidoreductase [Leucobacter sp.]